ncbi:pyroglutamyl-peptidase I [Candidatus Epulonipiscium fishelsonii]|nr:pyroglutamyl-peptidase I [Epulopiscium sp. SCG-C06WGA-EpuloA1]
MKVLLTGFDPFGGEKVNPASEAVMMVKDVIEGAEVIKLVIPTVRHKSIEVIENAIIKHNPDIVISIGQAGGRFDITPERVAINVDDYRIKDNEGNQPIDEAVYEDGDSAYFSLLPIKSIVQNLQENNIPSSISNTAGTFVCNHVMYGVLYLIDKKYPNIKGGFVHIPFMTSQVIDKKNVPFMALDEIVKGLEVIVSTCVLNTQDTKTVGGSIC